MSQHHTQRARSSQITRVRDLIIEVGGLKLVEDEIGLSHFVYYVAEEIGCTASKAKEYIRICKMSTIARQRIQTIKARVFGAKEVSHGHVDKDNSH